ALTCAVISASPAQPLNPHFLKVVHPGRMPVRTMAKANASTGYCPGLFILVACARSKILIDWMPGGGQRSAAPRTVAALRTEARAKKTAWPSGRTPPGYRTDGGYWLV